MADQTGDPPKTAVVTGSTGGIGHELVRLLAADGWHVVCVNRSAEKAASQAQQLRGEFPSFETVSFTADLGDTPSIRRVVEEIKASHPEIGLLVNNAGLLSDEITASPTGIDQHAQINTVAPLLLTLGLRDQLAAAAQRHGRAVVVTPASSAVARGRPLVTAELERPVRAGLFGAYAQSKLASAVLTARLAPSFAEQGIELYSIDPGLNRTAMTARGGVPLIVRLMWRLLPHPRKGAERLRQPTRPGWQGKPGAYVSGGKPKALPASKIPPGETDRLGEFAARQVAAFDQSIDTAGLLTPAET